MTAPQGPQALGEALDRISASLKSASDERYQNLREWEALGRRWKKEGDGYGYNFHMGMAAGANWTDILYQRIGREIEKIRAAQPEPNTLVEAALRETVERLKTLLVRGDLDPSDEPATESWLKLAERALKAARAAGGGA